jgi:hypothetical protein
MGYMTEQVPLNRSLVETAANTFTAEEVEVPNTAGAHKVVMTRCLVETTLSEGIAATQTETRGSVSVGQVKSSLDSAGQILANNLGVAALGFNGCYGVGRALACGENLKECFPSREVPKSSDGKFYVTLAVKGANNTVAKYVRIAAEFAVM